MLEIGVYEKIDFLDLRENIMKKKVLSAIIVTGTIMILTGCGESAVKCDDNEAQKIVMGISKDEIKNQLVKIRSRGLGTYAIWQELSDKEPGLKKAVEEIDKEYINMNPKLANIRTESIDDKFEKSECAAEIVAENGNKIDITYKLSKTSEGNLYAEVFGIK